MIFIPSEEYIRIKEALPILCVDCVIIHNQHCLLLHRRNHPARGQLWFPGGRLYKNELIADGALRKAFEEVHLRCEFQSIVTVEETLFPRVEDMEIDAHTVIICCHLSPIEMSKVTLDLQHESFQWVDREAALRLALHKGVKRSLSLAFSAKV